jgi:hypothetical protein
MTGEERRKRLIEKIVNKLDSRYVTIDMLERIYNIVNNA